MRDHQSELCSCPENKGTKFQRFHPRWRFTDEDRRCQLCSSPPWWIVPKVVKMLGTVAGSHISSAVLHSLRPKRGPDFDFSLRDNKMYMAVGWTIGPWTRAVHGDKRRHRALLCFGHSTLDPRSLHILERCSAALCAPLHSILHRSLRQSYKILNYCPLYHAAQPSLNAIRCREL